MIQKTSANLAKSILNFDTFRPFKAVDTATTQQAEKTFRIHCSKFMSSLIPVTKEKSYQVQKKPNIQEMRSCYHTHQLSPNQCSSTLVQTIAAPLPVVWSAVRSFSNPQAYKQFIKSCTMLVGEGETGSIREVCLVTGLPAESSVERLEKLDDDLHVMIVSIIGGDHRLVNYRSTTTVHECEEEEGGGDKTLVMESYVVDIPAGSCREDTCLFVDTIIACNLRSLASVAEALKVKDSV